MKVAQLRLLGSIHATTLQLLIMQAVTAGTAFVVNILSSAVMEPDGRGYLTLLIQITYMATVFALLGVERPYVAARKTNFHQAVYELQRLMRPSYVLLFLCALVCIVLFIQGHLETALPGLLILLYLAGNIGARLVRTGYIASSFLPPFLGVSVVTQVLLLAMAAGLFLLDNASPEMWFLVYGVSGLVAFVVATYSVFKSKGTVRAPEDARRIRLSGLKLLPASFGNTAMLRSDRLLLPVLASTSQLGLYIVVATMMELAAWPVQNWVDASLNKWRQNMGVKRSIWPTVMRAALFALSLAMLMGAVSYFLVRYVLSDAYAGSASLIIPLGVATVIYAASRVQQGLLIAAGRSKSVSGAELVGMVVSVVAYVLLIPLMGALGAAVGSIAGYLCCFAAGSFFLHKREARHVLR